MQPLLSCAALWLQWLNWLQTVLCHEEEWRGRKYLLKTYLVLAAETESSVSLVLKPGCRRKAANSCSVMQTWLLLKDPASFLASRDIYHLHIPMREMVRQTTKMELGKGWLLQEGKPASVFFRYMKVWFAARSNFFHFFTCINFFLHIYVANI